MKGQEHSLSGSPVQEPAVVVIPFEELSSTEDTRYLAKGIGQEIVRSLMRFPGIRLFTPPTTFGRLANRDPVKAGSDLGVAYVVTGGVRIEADEIRVSAQMLDATTGQVLWSETYERPLTPEALFHVEQELAGEIATALGQPYGVVSADLKDRLVAPDVSDMQSYICVLRAYTYRRDFAHAQFDPVLRCLEQAVRRDPNYSDAWAMLGWLHLDAGRIPYAGYGSTQEEFQKGLDAATRAVELEPNNTLAIKALSAVNHYLGRYDESERLARRALEINPNDPETLAHLGWRLAARGKFDEGIPFLNRAIARSVNPPSWYFLLIAVDLFLKGDYEQTFQVALRASDDGVGLGQALIAISAVELGKPDFARQALNRMWAFESFASDPAGFLRRHGMKDDIVDAIMAALEHARQVAAKS
jgi:TolB-like protein/tetratricopeptide (TPR) repeat protein